jgi:hypothetical protein
MSNAYISHGFSGKTRDELISKTVLMIEGFHALLFRLRAGQDRVRGKNYSQTSRNRQVKTIG